MEWYIPTVFFRKWSWEPSIEPHFNQWYDELMRIKYSPLFYNMYLSDDTSTGEE